mmetsp:Transcript_118000/g.376208  ORF Transcript_118000/g.376208 Transcript_118000/m.376208 type:complete len:235 (-) Transcript_118000:588-1292(-)
MTKSTLPSPQTSAQRIPPAPCKSCKSLCVTFVNRSSQFTLGPQLADGTTVVATTVAGARAGATVVVAVVAATVAGAGAGAAIVAVVVATTVDGAGAGATFVAVVVAATVAGAGAGATVVAANVAVTGASPGAAVVAAGARWGEATPMTWTTAELAEGCRPPGSMPKEPFASALPKGTAQSPPARSGEQPKDNGNELVCAKRKVTACLVNLSTFKVFSQMTPEGAPSASGFGQKM